MSERRYLMVTYLGCELPTDEFERKLVDEAPFLLGCYGGRWTREDGTSVYDVLFEYPEDEFLKLKEPSCQYPVDADAVQQHIGRLEEVYPVDADAVQQHIGRLEEVFGVPIDVRQRLILGRTPERRVVQAPADPNRSDRGCVGLGKKVKEELGKRRETKGAERDELFVSSFAEDAKAGLWQ
jgi:hypothetical protein